MWESATLMYVSNLSRFVPWCDNQIRAVKLFMGDTKTNLKRPINLVYPIEADVDQDLHVDDESSAEVAVGNMSAELSVDNGILTNNTNDDDV